jgi:hypothetical protein
MKLKHGFVRAYLVAARMSKKRQKLIKNMLNMRQSIQS